MTYDMQQQLSALKAQLDAFYETYKSELSNTTAIDNVGQACDELSDALHAINVAEEEGHANSSAANYKDYIREEEATTGRG